jgi:DNA-binding transcriptional ArsR family regulator
VSRTRSLDKKHVSILEDARLVTSEKQGRVRTCRLGPRRVAEEAAWLDTYRHMLEERLDHLGVFFGRTGHATGSQSKKEQP